MHKILLVCMANLCRSQLAVSAFEGVIKARRIEHAFEFDSAGTHARRHAGQRPDPRAIETATRRGYTGLAKRRARSITASDFERFDLLIAMDHDNLASLRNLCPPELQSKLHLLLDFAEGLDAVDIPDPYFGSIAGFERVLDLCEIGVTGLVNRCLRPPAFAGLSDRS